MTNTKLYLKISLKIIIKKIIEQLPTIILTILFTSIIIIGIKKALCLGFMSKLWTVTQFKLVQHPEYNQNYTNLNVSLTKYNEILNHYYNNQEKIKWCIVKLENPDINNKKFYFYYIHYFLQLYIDGYSHCINFPFTRSPMMGDTYLRITLIDFNKQTNSHCLTADATITTFNNPLKFSIIPENIQLSIKNKDQVINNVLNFIKIAKKPLSINE